ncbi:MAG: homoserine dehydrogenase [Eubacterium sp.]|nr:homoserine dehydrogenase [Eubacterium sp.]MDD7210125.1 homoserine dehydrogenase [Lachnospiraceae bacterium]MDY5496501.1 homoserine dehydrogenase [Anaerobutyricum sp.]
MEEIQNTKTIKAALLGVGTVGSGVYELVRERQDDFINICGVRIEIAKILVRDTSKSREGIPSSLLTDKWEEIIRDDEISVIIEVMGGIEPARTYILEAMRAGKQVITANKDLIAEHGHELLSTAEEMQCDLKFEAAVAGCIPIIQVLKHSMASEDITEIMGIVNGTTNYILTRMTQSGLSYEEALQEATDLGYAEADPAADVDGLDAGRKIAIMASIAFHSRVTFSDVYIEGIRKITAKDIYYAKEFGSVIKLLGIAKKTEDGIEVKVLPILIPKDHPLATVNDSYNAVFVHGTASGDTMYYGRGAGKLPTASAVTGDLCTVVRHLTERHNNLHVCSCYRDIPVKNIKDTCSRFFLRLQVEDRPGVLANISSVFGTSQVSIAQVVQKSRENGVAELVIITDEVKELYFSDAMSILEQLSIIKNISSLIRVYE